MAAAGHGLGFGAGWGGGGGGGRGGQDRRRRGLILNYAVCAPHFKKLGNSVCNYLILGLRSTPAGRAVRAYRGNSESFRRLANEPERCACACISSPRDAVESKNEKHSWQAFSNCSLGKVKTPSGGGGAAAGRGAYLSQACRGCAWSYRCRESAWASSCRTVRNP